MTPMELALKNNIHLVELFVIHIGDEHEGSIANAIYLRAAANTDADEIETKSLLRKIKHKQTEIDDCHDDDLFEHLRKEYVALKKQLLAQLNACEVAV